MTAPQTSARAPPWPLLANAGRRAPSAGAATRTAALSASDVRLVARPGARSGRRIGGADRPSRARLHGARARGRSDVWRSRRSSVPTACTDLGGRFVQYVRAPLAYLRHFRDADIVVDVENGDAVLLPDVAPRAGRCASCTTCTARSGACTSTASMARVGLEARAAGQCRWHIGTRLSSRCPLRPRMPCSDIGVPASSISVMVNGVDLPAPIAAARWQEPLFVALGRLVAHKRLDLLLRVWERVRSSIGGRLVIAGGGPEYERLCASGWPRCRGRRAACPRRRSSVCSSSAWLLVHPALHEGWGIVVMEAAAHATPTLGFDVPGVRDAVQPDVTGVLVGDEQAFVERWLQLAGDAPDGRSSATRGQRAGTAVQLVSYGRPVRRPAPRRRCGGRARADR